MTKATTYQFRRRTMNTSYDPYDSLTTTLTPEPNHYYDSSSGQRLSLVDDYWSNGNSVHFFMPPSSSILEQEIDNNASKKGNSMMNSQLRSFTTSSNVSSGNYKVTRASNNVVGWEENEVRNSILAGSIAGITSCSIFHPFDVVRTKIQASTKISETVARNSKTISRVGITSSSGPLAVISHTYKNGGIRAFYTGISLPLAAQALYKSTVFTTNRITSNFLSEYRTTELRKVGIFTPYQLNFSDRFICGSVSGAVNALLFVCPVEFVRNQLIQQHTKKAVGSVSSEAAFNGPLDVIKKTLKHEGFLGLWRGAGVTVVRDSIGCGAFFIMNAIGNKYINEYFGYQQGSWFNTIGSGFMAGFGYWFVSLPLDALKTLVQTGKSSSATETFSYLVKRDGGLGAITKLYRGWQLAFGRGSPSAAVTLTTYSIVYNFCGRAFS